MTHLADLGACLHPAATSSTAVHLHMCCLQAAELSWAPLAVPQVLSNAGIPPQQSSSVPRLLGLLLSGCRLLHQLLHQLLQLAFTDRLGCSGGKTLILHLIGIAPFEGPDLHAVARVAPSCDPVPRSPTTQLLKTGAEMGNCAGQSPRSRAAAAISSNLSAMLPQKAALQVHHQIIRGAVHPWKSKLGPAPVVKLCPGCVPLLVGSWLPVVSHDVMATSQSSLVQAGLLLHDGATSSKRLLGGKHRAWQQ